MAIPTFDTVDYEKPDQHVLPALVHLPSAGGASTVTHPSMLEDWSRHLTKCGYYNTEWLIERYADENGMIKASDLPRRTLKLLVPIIGPNSPLNPGSKWVDRNHPEPIRPAIPDLTKLTPEQLSGVLEQARELGLTPENHAPTVDKAEVIYG